MDVLPWLMLTVVAILALRWSRRRGWIDPSRERIRRGTGHALLGLREFIEPSVEHVFAAENAEETPEDDLAADEGNPALIREGLAESLRRSPLDHEEIRHHLTTAARAGLDWRNLYDEESAAAIRERPYIAPSMPPYWKVGPRG